MSMQIFNENVWLSSFLFGNSVANIFLIPGNGRKGRKCTSFLGALALGDLVKSTLGPKGMNKILQSASTGEINVTNDGATFLKAIQLDNAAAKILVNISKVQDDPQTIVEGYRIASNAALKVLEKAAVDNKGVIQKFRRDLFSISQTTLSSKVPWQDKDIFANLAVNAVLRLNGSIDLEHRSSRKWEGS